MRVLVVGSGGREHALAWKIVQSPRVDRVLAAPGSDGMGAVADCRPGVKAGDLEGICELAASEAVDLVVIGPEDPLAAGLADRLREAGVAAFGPSAAAAQLESSKAFAKAFMQRHGIPSADHVVVDDLDRALAHVRARGGPCVVKADGLAAGKGVFMCATTEEAEAALREIMETRRFGEAGARVVIEEWLQGEEASYHAITDGTNVATLASAQDYKRIFEGDQGENTGGMGAYSPAPVIDAAVEARILERIVGPAVEGMRAEGTPYTGVLYVGLIVDAEGNPSVIEFNARFGDPETQPLLVRMDGDLVPLLEGAARGALDPRAMPSFADAAVCVVLASEGYPRGYQVGRPIEGLADVESMPGVEVFHAGTRRTAAGGHETAGGRVLGVTARGSTVRDARDRAYAAASKIHFEGVTCRRDIAARAIDR